MIRIRVVDLEHTGEDENPTPVEIGWAHVYSESTDFAGRAASWKISPTDSASALLNPGKPIPPESSAIHHITDGDVSGALPWRAGIDNLFIEADKYSQKPDFYAAFAGDEADLLRPWTGDVEWLDVRKIALRIWTEAPNHKLQTLRYWRNPIGLERSRAKPAHRAYPDAYVAAMLLRDLLDDGVSIDDARAWSREPALEVRCWIGSGRGLKWPEVDTGLLHWILNKGPQDGNGGGFREDILFTVRHELARRETEWERQRQDQVAEAHDPAPDYDEAPLYDANDPPF